MNYYVILSWQPINNSADAKFDWLPITDPEQYLPAKATMQKMKKDNPDIKYKLLKTSY